VTDGRSGAAGAALDQLDAITRRLRVECPWDREQDERSIGPHTVEEAYELADAALKGDDAKLLDELGDVLFQVVFLALLLEERGAGDLGAVADHCRAKLIRRHPHVFGEVDADSAGEVLANWDQIKAETCPRRCRRPSTRARWSAGLGAWTGLRLRRISTPLGRASSARVTVTSASRPQATCCWPRWPRRRPLGPIPSSRCGPRPTVT
jgi:NTP pyrophosphatase (non-canonical NTP hydrolase)